RAGRLVDEAALVKEQRALPLALVHDIYDAFPSDHGALRGDRRVQNDGLLAVDDMAPGQAEFRAQHPRVVEGRNHRESWQDFQVLLIDEGELVLVSRIVTKSDAESVEDAIPRTVGPLDGRQRRGKKSVCVQRHSLLGTP